MRAVDGISFRVARGEMVGYIGPNGAGKSTTIKMLTGILTPSGGRLRVAGIDPSRERTRLAHRIGVVFGQRTTLWWDLPLRDSYGLVRRMYRIPDARYRANLDRCVELLDLGELLDVPVRQLSLGQRMRGDIAAALLHDPEVLYLDEPTIGLDVVSKAKVRGFLRDLNAERGTTVLLTTHDLTDIEQLCRRVMVIDHGRLMYDGALAGLHEVGESERTLVVDLERELPPIRGGGAAARTVKVEGPRQWLAFPASGAAAPLVARIAARLSAGGPVGAGAGHRGRDRRRCTRGGGCVTAWRAAWPGLRGAGGSGTVTERRSNRVSRMTSESRRCAPPTPTVNESPRPCGTPSRRGGWQMEEFEERLEAAYKARTLQGVGAAQPRSAGPGARWRRWARWNVPKARTGRRPSAGRNVRRSRHVEGRVAFLGGFQRKGRGRWAGRFTAFAFMGRRGDRSARGELRGPRGRHHAASRSWAGCSVRCRRSVEVEVTRHRHHGRLR